MYFNTHSMGHHLNDKTQSYAFITTFFARIVIVGLTGHARDVINEKSIHVKKILCVGCMHFILLFRYVLNPYNSFFIFPLEFFRQECRIPSP